MPEDANAVLARLNRALAELGMPAAELRLESGRGDLGWPEARLRLVHAGDPGKWYGDVRIPLTVVEEDDDA
jgi:hypothetical protein